MQCSVATAAKHATHRREWYRRYDCCASAPVPWLVLRAWRPSIMYIAATERRCWRDAGAEALLVLRRMSTASSAPLPKASEPAVERMRSQSVAVPRSGRDVACGSPWAAAPRSSASLPRRRSSAVVASCVSPSMRAPRAPPRRQHSSACARGAGAQCLALRRRRAAAGAESRLSTSVRNRSQRHTARQTRAPLHAFVRIVLQTTACRPAAAASSQRARREPHRRLSPATSNTATPPTAG